MNNYHAEKVVITGNGVVIIISFIFLPSLTLSIAGQSMTLLRADPFTPLSCPACDKKFKSRKEASKHVKCAHFTTLDHIRVPRTVTLYADDDDSDDVPPLTRDGDKVVASGTTNPAGDATLASGIIDADVGTAPDGNPALQALEPVGQSLSCPM